MMIAIFFKFVILFCFYSLISLIVYYYISLIFSKHRYNREEFTNLTPYKSYIINIWQDSFSAAHFISGLILFFIPFFLTRFLGNWLFNSILLIILFYYLYPPALKYFKSQETEGGAYHLLDIILDQYWYMLYVFALSLTASITLNWLEYRNMGTIFCGVNILGSLILMYHMLSMLMDYHSEENLEDL